MVWDLEQGKIVETHDEHTGWITRIVVARDGKTFVTSSSDRSLVVWDSATRQPLTRLRGHLAEVWSLALAPDGRTLASGSIEGTKLWDPLTRHTPSELTVTKNAAGFSADSRMLVAMAGDRAILWDVASGATRSMPLGDTPGPLQMDFFGHVADVHAREPFVVLGRADGSVELWNIAAHVRVVSWPGRTLAVGYWDVDRSRIRLWRAPSWEEINALEKTAEGAPRQ